MQPPVKPHTPADTRQRLLDAAAKVFAAHGLAGATTRVIAEEAGVNEVTLFRHFQTKDRLLSAVIGQHFGVEVATDASPAPEPTADIRADLLNHARRYQNLLQSNLSLVRTMLGEIHHRHRDQEKQVFLGIFGPVKADLLARIQLAIAKGQLQTAFPADLLADLFGGMIFTGVLRRDALHGKLTYAAEAYLEAAVELVVRGAPTRAPRP